MPTLSTFFKLRACCCTLLSLLMVAASVLATPAASATVGAVVVGSLATGCRTMVPELDRSRARTLYGLGVTLFRQGELRNALRELLGAVRLDPNLAAAHSALGLIFHQLGRLEDALYHHQEAVRIDPKFSEGYNNLGTLHLAMGNYQAAIKAFQKALDDILYATPALAEGNLGWAYFKMGNVDQAVHHLRNAVAQNAKFCRGYQWLSHIGVATKQPKMVLANGERFKRYCEDDPRLASAIAPEYLREMKFYVAQGHLEQGETEVARGLLKACAKTTQDPPKGFAARCAKSLAGMDGASGSPAKP